MNSNDKVAPNQPSGIKASTTEMQFFLSWTNPTNKDFSGILILRKEGSIPSSTIDGVQIYKSNGQSYTENIPNNDNIFYYQIYAYDKSGNYSKPILITRRPPTKKPQVKGEKITNNESTASKKYSSLAGEPGKIVDLISGQEAMEIYKQNNLINLDSISKQIYEKLVGKAKLSDKVRFSLAYFIKNGSPTTKRLGQKERAGVIKSFQSSFGKLPQTAADWQDIIKIANGRWPGKRNNLAENNAKINFKKIYKRNPAVKNGKDSNSIMILSYGLRPATRNQNSEKKAISVFKGIFKKAPLSAIEWDAVRTIAYSGSKR
jgi:hypothetical protein